MKSLVIAPQPFFSPRGTPMSVYYRALVVAGKGVEIDLLTYGEGQDVEIPGVRIIRTPRFGLFGNVKTGPSLLKIFLDIFIALWTVALLIRNRYDFVHAHEESVFIAALLQPIFRYKLVYDMHSSLPEQLNNFGWSKSNVLRRFLSWAEDSVLTRSQAVITICPALADFALSRIAEEDKEKHFLIENSIFEPVRLKNASTSSESSGAIEAALSALQEKGRTRTLVYAGTLETYQGIDLMLESMVIVARDSQSIGLLVAGGSAGQVDHYKAMASRLGIEDCCVFLGRVPQVDAKRLVALSDAVLSPRTRGMNTPLKVYELLDCGKPLVATRIPSHTQVLTDEVCFLADAEPPSFAEQMIAAVEDEERIARTIERAKALYESDYSRAAYEEKIERLLRRVA